MNSPAQQVPTYWASSRGSRATHQPDLVCGTCIMRAGEVLFVELFHSKNGSLSCQGWASVGSGALLVQCSRSCIIVSDG